jgi:hypothetical protein
VRRHFLRDNSLSICFGVLFLGALIGQAIAGHQDFNNEASAHHEHTISLGRYLTSSAFGQAVMENWQSEYLQFTLFVLLTIYLIQRGSPESKEPDKAGRESDEEQQIGVHADQDSPSWARLGGVRTWLYSNSLLILMVGVWLSSWLAQSFTGQSEYNDEQAQHHEPAVSWLGYVGTSSFWETTLQNWQSEFLAVGSFAIFTVYLRQRGSPESKPVGAPHHATGVEG